MMDNENNFCAVSVPASVKWREHERRKSDYLER